jgi:hypothetical protein
MDQTVLPPPGHNAPMMEDPVPSGRDRGEQIDRMARKLVGCYGAEVRQEIVRVIETLIDDGSFEMARLWTQVMHRSDRIIDSGIPPLHE